MSDYYATLKVQQGRIKEAMARKGMKTVAELSRACDVGQGTLGKLLNFKDTPRNKRGQWRPPVLRMCEALDETPEQLFPEHLQYEVLTNNIAAYADQFQLSGGVAGYLEPSITPDTGFCREALDEVMSTLEDREAAILRHRFYDEETLGEIGDRFGLQRERVRQIEAKALRKMRHPVRLRKLEPYLNREAI